MNPQPATERKVRQLDEDVLTLYEMLGNVVETQKQHTAQLDALNGRVDALERRMEAIEHRLDALEQRMDALERRMDAMEQRLGALESRMETVDTKLDEILALLRRDSPSTT